MSKKKENSADIYNPFEKEKYWQEFWEEEEIFAFDPDSEKPLYTIDTPPPTISGALHLGHVYSYTQAEVIARFRRMAGFNVRYPFGLDNNGLPTERLVEKEENIKGSEMELKQFVNTCLKTTEKYSKEYVNLFKSLGFSSDWRLEYSTISPEVQKLSQSVFKELYEKGLIYKSDAPMMYCTECHTSFAQAEKDDEEKETTYYDLAFKYGKNQEIVISTTRPEYLPACQAVFVHPNDERYTKLVGKKVQTPLGKKVTVLEDEKVDMKKGSGAVMCCTYGDEVDVYWKKIHDLDEMDILDKEGVLKNLSDIVPEMEGKDIHEGRKIIVEKLKDGGFVKGEEKTKHAVGVHERCGTPIEFITTSQWFVKMLDMKEELLEAGENIEWYPKYMKKRYREWVANLKWDWCISRERFFGIPIPVFHCNECDEILIPEKDSLPIDPKVEQKEYKCPNCKKGELFPERSVLDTWFTSSLTPDINSKHPLNGKLKGKMLPMSMRPHAHDIIRTWTTYTILMSLYRRKEIPWKELMISGHILFKKGQKISKKSGGGKMRPEELIKEKSSDPIRYTMFGATLGRDGYFEEKELAKGKKLVTKIYNAGKFTLNKLEDYVPKNEKNFEKLEAFDKWILHRSQETAKKMSEAFNHYEYAKARQIFEYFFWTEFCDNYLEIVKGRLDSESKEKESAQLTLYKTFLNILKLISPFMPHIAEEMYHSEVKESSDFFKPLISEGKKGYFFKNEGEKSIHKTQWVDEEINIDESIDEDVNLALFVIAEVRKFKTENQMKLNAEIEEVSIYASEKEHEKLEPFLKDLLFVTKVQKFKKEDGELKLSFGN